MPPGTGFAAEKLIAVYYRAASVQCSPSHERNVCPSVHPFVRLSVKLMDCDKTKESVPTFLHRMKEHSS